MEYKPIRVRLRPGKDDDIGRALEDAAKKEDKADIVRAALRLYFFGPKQNPAVHKLAGNGIRLDLRNN